jgi:hypothetical protein
LDRLTPDMRVALLCRMTAQGHIRPKRAPALEPEPHIRAQPVNRAAAAPVM